MGSEACTSSGNHTPGCVLPSRTARTNAAVDTPTDLRTSIRHSYCERKIFMKVVGLIHDFIIVLHKPKANNLIMQLKRISKQQHKMKARRFLVLKWQSHYLDLSGSSASILRPFQKQGPTSLYGKHFRIIPHHPISSSIVIFFLRHAISEDPTYIYNFFTASNISFNAANSDPNNRTPNRLVRTIGKRAS